MALRRPAAQHSHFGQCRVHEKLSREKIADRELYIKLLGD